MSSRGHLVGKSTLDRMAAATRTVERMPLGGIGDSATGPARATRGASVLLWAKITAVGDNSFTARAVDSNGTEVGDTFTVSVAAAVADSITIAPTLADLSIPLVVDQYVIVWHSGGFRAGYWLVGIPSEFCPESGV